MLHFLLGTALCIFIGERLWHYAAIIRLRREERRYDRLCARMLSTTPRIELMREPETPAPQRVYSPRSVPSFGRAFCMAWLVAGGAIIILHVSGIGP